MNANTNQKLLSIEEVADYLSVPTKTIYRWLSTGHLPHLKLSPGSRSACVRVDPVDLQAWLDARRVSEATR